jgi:long-subunit fatty acid transport protein
MLHRTPVKPGLALLFLVASVPPSRVWAQAPSPTPPERVFQDELDLQANANFVQGSGARAFGMGGAFLARADDATAASWNPAGLSYLRAPELSFVYVETDFSGHKQVNGINKIDFVDQPYRQTTQDDRSGGFPDFMAFTWPWEAGEVRGAVQFSFQRVVPFTGSRTISETVDYAAVDRVDESSRSVESTGGFDILALGTGVQVTRKLRLGLVVNRWLHGYEQTVLKPEQRVPSRQNSEFDVGAWNLHLGAIVSPWESLNLGFVFKTGLTADATLRRVRYDVFGALDGARANFNLFSNDEVKLTLPGALGVGASWRPRSNLTLSMDYTRTNWSEGEIRNFFALARANLTSPLEYPAPDPLHSGDFCGQYPRDYPPDEIPTVTCPPTLPYPTLDTSSKQADTDQVRAGIEYVIIKSRLKWPVRAGYFRDSQFFRALDGDAPIFDGFTVGTGLILGNVLFDVAYVYETGRYTDRNIATEVVVPATPTTPAVTRVIREAGDNSVKSHKIYASVIYRLSGRR